MTTYRTTDGQEFERYEKFLHYQAVTADVTWIPLLIGENRVRFYAQSTLVEVKSPFDSGMDYCYPAIPQNFDSGLDYCYPQPFKPLIIALPADMIGQTPIPRGKNKRPTIAGVILADCAHVTVIQPVTLWHSTMREAA